MPNKQEPKSKPPAKIDMLLEVAMEAQYFRAAKSNLPMVLIPNHPTRVVPSVLAVENYDFVSWLTWRCYKVHAFIPSTALINAVLRFLTGMALYDESIPEWNIDAETAAATPSPRPEPQTKLLSFSAPAHRPATGAASSGGMAA